MIDIQIYNGEKEVRHISNVGWVEAHKWLDYTRNRLESSNKVYTYLDIQVYTVEGMPVDSVSSDYSEGRFEAEHIIDFAHRWLRGVLKKAEEGGYPGVWV